MAPEAESGVDSSPFKYPNRQTLPASHARTVPVIIQGLRPLLVELLTGDGSVRLLEVAAGYGLVSLGMAEEVEEVQRAGSSSRDVSMWATEADDHLVSKIRENFEQRQQQRDSPRMKALRLEIDERSDWDHLQAQEQPVSGLDLTLIVNLLHIVPWSTVETLFDRLTSVVATGGWVVVYGAFNENGQVTSDGNAKFDQDLQSRDKSYGLRDVQSEVAPLAKGCGFGLREIKRVAAGNLMLFFQKEETPPD